MLPLEFIGQNVHFAIDLLAALVFLAVFWLYFDAWLVRREQKELFKWLGFLLVSVSYVLSATALDQGIQTDPALGGISTNLALILRFVGYLMAAYGVFKDPLVAVPHDKGLQLGDKEAKQNAVAPIGFLSGGLTMAVPASAFLVAFLYLRRSTKGLERHLRPMAIGLAIVASSDLVHISTLWQRTTDPVTQSLVAPYGPAWIIEHALLLLGVLLVGKWVWQYLTKRLQTQLFMILTTMILGVYLLTTVCFTYLLFSSVQQQSLDSLKTASNVMQYAINSKKAETQADAEGLSDSSAVQAAVESGNHDSLVSIANGYLENKQVSELIITNASGQVLLRGSDPNRWGDSLSGDPLIKRSLIGIADSGAITKQGVLAPEIMISSATPIQVQGQIIGSITVSLLADNAFVDGIKSSTGLDTALYGGNVRSATTFTTPGSSSRLIGATETSAAVNKLVLGRGQTFVGALSVQNQPYLAVYSPLKDVDNSVIGMLFIGKPEASILQTAGHSIQITFAIAAVLLMLSILPVYYVSRYLTGQLK